MAFCGRLKFQAKVLSDLSVYQGRRWRLDKEVLMTHLAWRRMQMMLDCGCKICMWKDEHNSCIETILDAYDLIGVAPMTCISNQTYLYVALPPIYHAQQKSNSNIKSSYFFLYFTHSIAFLLSGITSMALFSHKIIISIIANLKITNYSQPKFVAYISFWWHILSTWNSDKEIVETQLKIDHIHIEKDVRFKILLWK